MHLNEENALLRQHLDEMHVCCHTFAELEAENHELKENLQERRHSSEEAVAKLKQEIHELHLNSEVKESPIYTELKASKEGLKERLEESCKAMQLLKKKILI